MVSVPNVSANSASSRAAAVPHAWRWSMDGSWRGCWVTGLSVIALIRSRRRVGGEVLGGVTGEAAPQSQRDIHQGDQDRHFDQRADDPGEGLTGGGAVGRDRHRDREFEVVACGGECQRGGALIA